MLIRTLRKLMQRLTRRRKERPAVERLNNRERRDIGLPPLPDPWVNPHVLPPARRPDW